MRIGFNADVYEKQRKRGEKIGQWAVVFAAGSNIGTGGRIKDITDDYITLNPKQGIIYDEGGVSKRTMIEHDIDIPISGAVIDYSTEEQIRNFTKKPFENSKQKPSN